MRETDREKVRGRGGRALEGEMIGKREKDRKRATESWTDRERDTETQREQVLFFVCHI